MSFMKLTPIRVRGKTKSRKSEQAIITSPPSSPSSSGSASQFAQHAKRKSNRAQYSELKSAKRRRPTLSKLSKLEQLPVELLQNIFLLSGNPSLPQSSLNLAARLSSEHIFTRFCLDTVLDPALPNITQPPPHWISTTIPKLTQLLRCRFFTFDFYCRCTRRLYENYCIDNVRKSCREYFSAALREMGEELEPSDYGDLRDVINTLKRSKDPMGFRRRNLPGYINLSVYDSSYELWNTSMDRASHPQRVLIPEKLLHGPWTEDKTDFLYVLTLLRAQIDWTSSTAGETATLGLVDAIREQNSIAVGALLKAGVRPTSQMIQMAVMEVPFNRPVIAYLLSIATTELMYKVSEASSASCLDLHDPCIWNWAESQHDHNKADGEWLKIKLRIASDLESNMTTPTGHFGEDKWLSLIKP